jgi:hypothetical protein
MSFEDVLLSHQRLCILRHLKAARGYSANESLLKGILDDFGLHASRDLVSTLVAWLDEQGLVTRTFPLEAAIVATITVRGIDVASGDATVPGVLRPGPASRLLKSAGGL